MRQHTQQLGNRCPGPGLSSPLTDRPDPWDLSQAYRGGEGVGGTPRASQMAQPSWTHNVEHPNFFEKTFGGGLIQLGAEENTA